MTRVVLVVPDTLIRGSLKCLLLTQRDIAVVADVTTLDAAVKVMSRTPADIVLVYLNGGEDNWRDVLATLNRSSGAARLMLLAPGRDAVKDASAVESGVSGVVYTDQTPEMLFKALKKVHAGEVWLERSSFVALLERRRRQESSPEQERIRTLTKREREIIIEIGAGLKNRDVARRLAISEATVRNHLTSILDKLALTDRTELALFSLRYGLAPCPACARVHDAHERLGATPDPRAPGITRPFRSRSSGPNPVSAR